MNPKEGDVERTERDVGTSLLSFGTIIPKYPRFYVPGGYDQIAGMIGDLGIQLLPVHGLTKEHVRKFRVMSIEGPWNSGSLGQVVKRTLRIRPDYPSFIDFGLFGTNEMCWKRIDMMVSMCPSALPIDIAWIPGSAIELGPDMSNGLARTWGKRTPSGVVLDTKHWRELGEDEAETRLAWYGGPEAIKMVHLKLETDREAREFLNQTGNNYRLLCRFLAYDQARRIPVIIEAHPRVLGLVGEKPEEVLREIASAIKCV